MRQAKHMISKYNGKCNDCGRPIAAGEPIYWKARGVVQCSDCMPGNDNAPASDTLPNSAAGSWSNALAWNSAPQPGASIGAANPAPVATSAQDYAQASQPATARANPAPQHINDKLADINARIQAEHAASESPAPAFTVVSSNPAPESTPETTPAQPFGGAARANIHAPADDFPIAIMQDQLVMLVNAISRLTPDQVATLRDYCADLSDSRDFTRKHCFNKLAELFGA